MEAAGSSKSLLTFYQTTQRHIPEDRNFIHLLDNLRSRTTYQVSRLGPPPSPICKGGLLTDVLHRHWEPVDKFWTHLTTNLPLCLACSKGRISLNVKVNFCLCLIRPHAVKNMEDWVSIAPALLTSELDGGEWSFLRSGRFTSEERASGINWIGCWVNPRVGLYSVENKSLALGGNQTPILRSFALVA
jgi:hypothetical protein